MAEDRTPQQMTLDIIRIAEILSQNQLDFDSCYKQEEKSRQASKEIDDDPPSKTLPS